MESDEVADLFNFLGNGNSNGNTTPRNIDGMNISEFDETENEPSAPEKELLEKIQGHASDDVLLQKFEQLATEIGGKPILLEYLDRLIEAVSANNRHKIAARLSLFVNMDRDDCYRYREEFVGKLVRIVSLFDANATNQFFSGFALSYSADRIGCIREKGIGLLAIVISKLLQNEWSAFVESDENATLISRSAPGTSNEAASTVASDRSEEDSPISEVSENPSTTEIVLMPLTDQIIHEARRNFLLVSMWRRRQSYGRLLYGILNRELITAEQFCHIFFEDLMRVSTDPVPNVRQYFCLVANWCMEGDFLADNKFIAIRTEFYHRLSVMAAHDSDAEIRYQAQTALNGFGDEEFDT